MTLLSSAVCKDEAESIGRIWESQWESVMCASSDNNTKGDTMSENICFVYTFFYSAIFDYVNFFNFNCNKA